MVHPLLEYRKYLWTYALSWLLITIAHFLFLFVINHDSLAFALIDAFIFNITFAICGLAIFFVTYYAGIDKRFGYIVLNHFFSALIVVGVWLLVSVLLLNFVFSILEMDSSHTALWYQLRFLQGLFYYIVISLLYYLLRTSEANRQAKTDVLKLENDLKEAQLQALKSQINPHFLFNSLNSISYLVKNDGEKAREMLSVLSDYFRYSLKNQANLSTIDDELVHCRKYLEIEQVRFGEKLKIEEKIEKTVLDVLVPTMILQPLYENAVKHGVYESNNPVTIRTILKDHDDYVSLTIENNFEDDAVTRKGEGIGLKNVAQRLEITFGASNLFAVTKKQNTFSVEITIPKKNYK